MRSLNFNGELASASVSELYSPTAQSFGSGAPVDGFYSPELRGEFGAGLLDLHAMDDSELLSEVFLYFVPAIWPCVSTKIYVYILMFLLLVPSRTGDRFSLLR